MIHTGLTCSLRNNAVMFLHLVLYLRNPRSLAAKPPSIVATVALTHAPFGVLVCKWRIDPRNKGPRFVDHVPLATPTCRAVIELLLPCTPGDLVELFKEKLVNRETPPLFETAYGALFKDLVVSGQRPHGVAHV